MDYGIYNNEAALAEASQIAAFLADAAATPPVVSKIRLFDGSLIPTVSTTHADLVNAEVTFTGYPVGGYSVTVMNGPVFGPSGGAVILSNEVFVKFTTGTPETVGGWWLEDPTPSVRLIVIYNPQRVLAVVGNGWPIVAQLAYGVNQGAPG